METMQKIVLLIAVVVVLYLLYKPSSSSSTSTPSTPSTPSPTTPKPTYPPVPESLLNGPLNVYSASGQNNNFTLTFSSSDHSVSVPKEIQGQFPLANMTYNTTSISGTYTNGSIITLPLSYNGYNNQITLYANGNPLFILKAPVPTTKPTYQPVSDSLLNGTFQVYSVDGSNDEGYAITFSNKDRKISAPEDFPLTNLTFTSTAISGTYKDGNVLNLPISSKGEDMITIYDVNDKPIHLLKRVISTPSPSAPSTSLDTPKPTLQITPSPTPTAYVPVIQPTDPPSSIKGQYIQIKGNTECLSIWNVKVYSSPYGGNVMEGATITSSSIQKNDFKYDTNFVKNLSDDYITGQQFMTDCFTTQSDNKLVISGKDKSPWIMINLGSVMPIYKIVINNSFLYPNVSLGATMTILDDSKSIVYTGKALADKNGNTINEIKMDNEFFAIPFNSKIKVNDYYGSYTFYPSISKDWIGGSMMNPFMGVWVAKNGDVLSVYGDGTLSLNVNNGPVDKSTYKILSANFAYTSLGITPAPTSSANAKTPIPTLPKIGSTQYNNENFNVPPINMAVGVFNNSLSLNNVEYYLNRFWTQSWLSSMNGGTLLTFDRNMKVTKTVNGVVTKGTYILSANDTGTMTFGNTKSSIVFKKLSNSKVYITVDDIIYYPNTIIGTWVTIDQEKPVVATFDGNGGCLIESISYQYSNVYPSLETNVDYTYSISPVQHNTFMGLNASFPVYGAKGNSNVMSLYDATNSNKFIETFIKNNFVGTWSGQVSSGATVVWSIDPFYVKEIRSGGKTLPIGSYWIHGPNTQGVGMTALVKTSGSTTYNLVYGIDNNGNKTVSVYSSGDFIVTLSQKS